MDLSIEFTSDDRREAVEGAKETISELYRMGVPRPHRVRGPCRKLERMGDYPESPGTVYGVATPR